METNLDQQTYSRRKLASVLADRKAKNPLYSLRALARSLKVPASTLSDFLNDKKDLTPSTNLRVMLLLLSPEELDCFRGLPRQAEFKVVEVQSLVEIEKRSLAESQDKMFFSKTDSTYYVYVDAETKKQITKIHNDLIKRALRLSKRIRRTDSHSRISIHFSVDD